jgi:membrane associated rhomboid family serine protease
MFYERSEDYRPLFWAMGRPVYVNTLILALHVTAFTLGGIALFSLGFGVIEPLYLSTNDVLHYGQVWRLISYVIFLPTDSWSAINFVFAMGFLYYFGRQVEEYIGRKTYAALYATIVLLPAVLLCLIGLGWPQSYMGGYGTIFGVFVAYATLYPGVEICIWFVNLTAKIWAFVLLGVLTLANLAQHDSIGLGGLWTDAAIGYLGMRYIGAGRGLEWITDWLDDRRTQKLARERNFKVLEDKKATDTIDAILEKISKHGVNSLDARERDALERARANLIKRDQR